MTEKELKEQYSKFCREMLEQIARAMRGESTVDWFEYMDDLRGNLEFFAEFHELDAHSLSNYQDHLFRSEWLNKFYPYDHVRLQWLRNHA